MGLPARLHIGADAAVPDQVHGRLEQRVDQVVGGQLVGLDAEARLHLRRDDNALGAAQKDTATLGDQRGVIVGPGGARQGEHSLTLGKALRRIRVGVDEDVHVVEGSDHLQLVRQQQAIAEHVTGHVADADHRGQILLDVDALLAEMPLHRDPAALGGNAHALVVVAGRTARGERVAQPEAVVQGNTVGDIGEGRRALVSRHHQVGVVGVVAYHVARRHDLTILEVVGDIQQATDENAVAGDALCQYLITVAAHRHLARDEAALGAHRHNHRILHLLRLDQTQHLGAVVFLAVGPAQTTTGHVAKAQVYALDARAVDEDFELGHWSRNVGNRAGVELEAEVWLGLTTGIGLIEVGAQGGLDQIQIAPEDAVLVEHRDIVQRGENGLLQLLLLGFQVVAGELAGQVETGLEQTHQLAGDVGMVDQRAGDVAVIEAQTDLLEVTGIGPQHRHITPRQTGGQHQTVEGIVLGIAVDDVHEGILQGLVEHLNIRHLGAGIGEGEIVNPELAAILAAQAVGELAQHPQAEVFQNRQHIRQRQRRIGVVELAVQLRLALGQRLVEAHHQRPLLGQAEQMLHVDHRRVRCKALGVAGREAFGEIGQHLGAVPLAQALQHQAGVIILPRAAGLDHFLLQAGDIHLHAVARIDAQNELHPCQHRLGEVGPELAVAGLQTFHENLLDLHADLGGVHIARHIGQAVAEAPVGIAAQEDAQLVALLNLHDADRGVEQLIDRGLEQIITRQHFEDLAQLLAQMPLSIEARTARHLGHLVADVGNVMHALGIHRRGVQAHEAVFANHLALAVQLAQRNEIRVGRPMHPARLGGLGEGQQDRLAQVAGGFAVNLPLTGRQPLTQHLAQAQQRAFVVDDARHTALLLHAELLEAEEGEVVVDQPAEEHLDLLQLARIALALAFAHAGQQSLGACFHRREIGNGQTHLGEHFLQCLLQSLQRADIGAAVDLQVHQRFMLHILAGTALGQ